MWALRNRNWKEADRLSVDLCFLHSMGNANWLLLFVPHCWGCSLYNFQNLRFYLQKADTYILPPKKNSPNKIFSKQWILQVQTRIFVPCQCWLYFQIISKILRFYSYSAKLKKYSKDFKVFLSSAFWFHSLFLEPNKNLFSYKTTYSSGILTKSTEFQPNLHYEILQLLLIKYFPYSSTHSFIHVNKYKLNTCFVRHCGRHGVTS